MVAAKTQPDCQDSRGKWLQRCWKDEKYTWTISGVLWNNIKERCTSGSATQLREPTYLGARNVQYFVDWNKLQVGYAHGYDLDSDILKREKVKIYSAGTCLLIPPALNRFLQSYLGKRSNRPQGVGIHKSGFYVKPSFDYLTGEEVRFKYRTFKAHEIEKASDYYSECKNYFGRLWVNRLKSGVYTVDERVLNYMENWRYTNAE